MVATIGACVTPSSTERYLSSCVLPPLSLSAGDPPGTMTTAINYSPKITQVSYVSGSPGVATVTSPDGAPTPPYTTSVTAVSSGTSSVINTVSYGGFQPCTNSGTVTVSSVGPWWQVMDGDVTLSRLT